MTVVDRRNKLRLAALLGLSAVWLLLLCSPALAHATLVETYPADADTLAESPEQVRLRFDEPIEAAFDPVKVYDQQGDRVDEDDARVDPNDAKVLVGGLEELPDGAYTVEWRITSIDGHIIDDTYQFAVAASAGQSPVTAQTDNEGAEEPNAVPQEDVQGNSSHTIPLAVLGIAALVVLLLALVRHARTHLR
jgi:methionine-rich copper-binding protein CopC